MASAAVVARTAPTGLEYLVRTIAPFEWATNAKAATRFQNLREATREATRLPSTLRAFALPAAGA